MIRFYAVKCTVGWDSIEAEGSLETIPPAERLRILKFKKNEDKTRALLGVLLSRYALAKALQTRDDELVIERDEYGRPFLASPHWEGDFNLSHSGEWVVCAVTSKGKIGVDIEKVEVVDINLFKGVLTSRELELLAGSKEEAIPAFYSLWSKKESFVKALGSGLSQPIDKFEFVADPAGDCYQVRLTDAGILPSWKCKDFLLDKGYSLAVCTDQPSFPKIINLVSAAELFNPPLPSRLMWYHCEH
ncbi:4'-phosphopantetheinyl transferase family protein [Mesobacillus foraminis]|uniref:4'-phosphopantetheinyl transferase family protein n=1 Tax=Mesobacillus foraminis TaxID=279826 RepID=UPI000EF4942C|nr:4'-phosphopantetheinyl transferase superfamily protein [Mesobacillus foraminis]